MTSLKFLIISIFFISSSLSLATTRTGHLFEEGSEKKKLLFLQKIVTKQDAGKKLSQSSFQVVADKSIAVEEELVRSESGEFERYMVMHKQLNEKWLIEKKKDRVHFRKVNFTTNKVKTDDESWPDNFVVGPMVMDHLRTHWKKLEKGDSLKVRFGVPARLETVGFKFFKEGEEKRVISGKKVDVVHVIMKPSSFLIAALVSPIHFYIRKSDKSLVELKGRTLPRKKKDGKWKDMDVEVVYKD